MSMLQHGLSEDSSYTVNQSLRFRASNSAYLSRTFGSGGNRLTWTWSAWIKRGKLGVAQSIFEANSGNGFNRTYFYFLANDTLTFNDYGSSSTNASIITTQVFRDVSAHFHLQLTWDTTNATAADRLRLYINGTRVTSFSTQVTATQNLIGYCNSVYPHIIGNEGYASQYFDGYLSEINFIDGQALDPSYFGQTDPVTGIWVPKKYTGTYGTNGFYLPFNDATSLTTLGYDRSGNGNNWTCNGISITAGATYDVMKDSPTNGPNEVGNYATWNPLLNVKGFSTITNANMLVAFNNTGNAGGCGSNIPVSSGKWYVECMIDPSSGGTTLLPEIGIARADYNFYAAAGLSYLYSSPIGYVYKRDGTKANNGSSSAYGASFTINDIIGVALDLDAGTLTFYKNGVSQGVAYSGLTGEYIIATDGYSTGGNMLVHLNCGQRPFAYTPPTGFKPLHTGNLTQPTIKKPQQHFDVKLDTGANIKTTCEGLFTYFLEWIKDRANSNNHQLIDTVRGTSAVLQSNTTAAETTYSAPSGSSVGWVFNAGSAAVSNTAGSITSQVSANVAAGFSVVTYTGTGANATVGHGLGVVPKMVITKARAATVTDDHWQVYHNSIGATDFLKLSTTDAKVTALNRWNNTTPTTSVFSIGTIFGSKQYVAYCFAEVAGYSKFGSYTGNGSTDGPFVFCGFRPRFVLIKNITAASDWLIHDTARDTYNPSMANIYAEASNSEIITGAGRMDILSNGFKLWTDAGYNPNVSGNTYIFAAFAESPFALNNRAR